MIETHDEDELARAIRLGSPLLGINNRDLLTSLYGHKHKQAIGIKHSGGGNSCIIVIDSAGEIVKFITQINSR